MFLFAISSIAPNPDLGKKIEAIYPNDYLRVSDTLWFVAEQNVTPAQVCEKLGVRSITVATGFADVIAVRVQSYFGYANNAIWQWLQLKGATL